MRLREDWPPRYRNVRTVAVYAAGVCLACGCSVLGPTLPSLGYLLGTDTTHMALAPAGLRLGCFGGTLLCGALFAKVPMRYELQLAISCFCLAVTMAIASWLSEVYTFITTIVAMGMCLGYIDSGGQPYIMALWKDHRLRNTLLQGLHLNWSIVATVVPYIISLFLVDIPENHINGHHINSSHADHNETLTHHFLQSTINRTSESSSANHTVQLRHMITPLFDSERNKSLTLFNYTPIVEQHQTAHLHIPSTAQSDVGFIRWAYVLLSLVISLNTCFLVSVYLFTRNKLTRNDSESDNTDAKTPIDMPSASFSSDTDDVVINKVIVLPRRRSRLHRNVLLVLLFFFAFLYQCVEGVPGSFLTTFCARGLNWHLDQGALITTVYWGMLGTSRLLSVALAWIISPRTQIAINLSALIVALTLMQFVHSLGAVSMWFSIALYGLGLGSTLPSSFLWIADFMPITPWVISVGNAGMSLAGVVMLSLTGYLFDQSGPDSMLYLLAGCGIAFVAVFALMQLWASCADCRDEDETDTEEREDTKSLRSNMI